MLVINTDYPMCMHKGKVIGPSVCIIGHNIGQNSRSRHISD